MSDQGLTAPKQVDYVIVTPRNRRKRLRLTGVVLTVVLIICGTVILLRSRSEAHAYKPVDMSAIGLKASLRTKLVSHSVRYVFSLKPMPGTEPRFASVMKAIPLDQLYFGIHLQDADGFEVCEGSPALRKTDGPDGKPLGLHSDGILANCSEDQIRTVSNWYVSFHYPLLTADLNPAPRAVQEDGLTRSKLTGTDFTTGEIETLDRGSFKVVKKAEYDTLIGWTSPDTLGISCDKQACVITNLRTQESVHAKKTVKIARPLQ